MVVNPMLGIPRVNPNNGELIDLAPNIDYTGLPTTVVDDALRIHLRNGGDFLPQTALTPSIYAYMVYSDPSLDTEAIAASDITLVGDEYIISVPGFHHIALVNIIIHY